MSAPVVARARVEITTSDLKGLAGQTEKDLQTSLSGTAKVAEAEMGAAGAAGGKAFGESASKSAKSSMAGLFGKVKASLGPLLGLGAALGVAEFFKGAVDAGKQAEQTFALTTAVIKSTGGAAHVSAADVKELSDKLGDYAGQSADSVQQTENLILTFTNIRNEAGKGNDIFNQTTKAVLDMSAAMHTDARSASILLGKALNDPVKGLTALTRVGVTFDEGQKNQIKSMMAANNLLGAQKIVLKEVNREFGGAAAAMATPAQKLQASWHNFQEEIGLMVLPMLDNLMKFITVTVLPVLLALAKEIEVDLKRAWADIAPVVRVAVGLLGDLVHVLSEHKALVRDVVIALLLWKTTTVAVAKAQLAYAAVDKLLGRLVLRYAAVATSARGAAVAETEAAAAGGKVGASVALLTPGAAVAGIAALAFGIGTLIKKMTGLGNNNDMLGKTFGTLKSAQEGFTQALETSHGKVDAQTRQVAALAAQQSGLADSAGKIGISLGALTNGITGSDAQFKSLFNTMKDAGASNTLLLSLTTQRTAFTNGQAAAAQYGTAVEVSGEKAGAAATEQANLEKALTDAKNALYTTLLDTFNKSLDTLSNNSIDAEQQELKLRDSLASASKDLKGNGAALDEVTVKGRANREWLLTQISAINSHVVAVGKQTNSIPKATAALASDTAQLRAAASAAGLNTRQVNALIQKYAATPKKVATYMEAQTAAAANKIAALQTQLDRLKGKVISIDVYQTTHQIGPAAGGHLAPGKAGGGDVLAGHRYTVGEYHAETFIPAVDGRISTSSLPARLPARGGDGAEAGGLTEAQMDALLERLGDRVVEAVAAGHTIKVDGQRLTSVVNTRNLRNKRWT